MMRLALAVAACLALLGAAWGLGYRTGEGVIQARLAAATVAAQAAAAEVASKLAAAEQARRQAAQALEDLANASPVTNPDCLPVDRVRRLNLR